MFGKQELTEKQVAHYEHPDEVSPHNYSKKGRSNEAGTHRFDLTIEPARRQVVTASEKTISQTDTTTITH
jgi:hypothetical protein